MPTRWITFDCFGTLVDWHAGFEAALRPFAGERSTELMDAFYSGKRLLEAEKPHRLYKDVLVAGLLQAGDKIGLKISETSAQTLPLTWGTQPIFDDVEPMLSELRAMDCKLAVLTNCDDDLFAKTQRCFRQPFDLVITAEQVRDYKPSTRHFERFAQVTNASPREWVHVACSWYHDIVPTRKLGILRIWLDRDDTGEDPACASARVRSASEVCAAIRQLANRKGSDSGSF
jgi:2-haloacid dehalogenase